MNGRPCWRYAHGDVVIEKSILMPYRQNTTYVSYRLSPGSPSVVLTLEPAFDVRPHEGAGRGRRRRLHDGGGRARHRGDAARPPLSARAAGAARSGDAVAHAAAARAWRSNTRSNARAATTGRGACTRWAGSRSACGPGDEVTLVVSTESWEQIEALSIEQARALDDQRRLQLIAQAHPALRAGVGAELVLAADQFVITPHTRPRDETRLAAEGDSARTIIAGYPWFTDWGRDTMISLEGLTLVTGRHDAARAILHTFAHHVRDGLIPNLFPEGGNDGLYHTADATLWFFHALDRYEHHTGDVETRRLLLPRLVEIIAAHIDGTRFGIGVDPADGLLRQGAPGYQLTWMDAKVGDWVVTPRRGKAVEINALFYNALRVMERWLREVEARGTAASGRRPARAGRRRARRPRRRAVCDVQRPLLVRGRRLPLRRRRRRDRRRRRQLPPQPGAGDVAALPGARPCPLAAGAASGARSAGDAVRAALAGARPSRLQAPLRRRPARARRRLPPGDGVGVADRSVRRRLAARASRTIAPARAACSPAWTPSSPRRASARSARSTTPSRRSRRAAAWPRRGASPRRCARFA